MYIEITPDDYRVQFRYQALPDYGSEIIPFAKLKQDLIITLADDVADKTFADIAFAIAHDVAVILNDTERKVYARLSAYDDGNSYTFDALTDDGRGVWTVTNEDVWAYELVPIGGGSSDHRELEHRDAANQHPISAITGLQSALDGKQPSGDYALTEELDALAAALLAKYEKPSSGIPESDLSEGVQTKLNAKEVFVAEYGVTTYNEIVGAHNNGKEVIIAGSDTMRISRVSASNVQFIAIVGSYVYTNTCASNNVWSSSTKVLEETAHRVTSLSSSSTDTQYPSAKCVYDNVYSLDTRIASLEADYAIALTLL